jgi:hypothetical protein
VSDARFLMWSDEFVIQFVFWAAVVVTVGVSTFWPWWKTDLGRTIILEVICLATILLPSTLRLELQVNTDQTFWQWWVAITFFLAGCIIIWRAFVVWKYQRYEKLSAGEKK